MPVERNQTWIDELDVIDALTKTWHHAVNLSYRNFDTESYHPIEELEQYITRVTQLQALLHGNDTKLNQALSSIGIYVLAKDFYRIMGHHWELNKHGNVDEQFRLRVVASNHKIYNEAKLLATAYSNDPDIQTMLDDLKANLNDLNQWYQKTLDVILVAMNDDIEMQNMYVDSDFTESDWHDCFEDQSTDEFIDHTLLLESISNILLQLMDRIYNTNNSDVLDRIQSTLAVPKSLQ